MTVESDRSGNDVVTVLVVDDSTPFRQAAANVVRATRGFRLVGEAASGEEAIVLARSLAPDLVLMDVRMPGLDGIAAAGPIAADHPATMIVLLTASGIDEAAEALLGTTVTILEKHELRPRTLEALWATEGGSTTGRSSAGADS